jgi:hypothetical protein
LVGSQFHPLPSYRRSRKWRRRASLSIALLWSDLRGMSGS